MYRDSALAGDFGFNFFLETAHLGNKARGGGLHAGSGTDKLNRSVKVHFDSFEHKPCPRKQAYAPRSRDAHPGAGIISVSDPPE